MSRILLVENNFLTESSRDEKSWYIEGVFAQAEALNKNRRRYPEAIMDREVQGFQSLIESNQAGGELNHPESSQVNPDRIAIKIESLKKEGLDYIGRAKVLNTSCGQTLQALLEGGMRMGVSTRGTGTVTKQRDGSAIVNNDYGLVTIDAVMNPSAPKAVVDAIYEGMDFEHLMQDESLQRQYIQWLHEKEHIKSIPNKFNREAQMVESVEKLLKTLVGNFKAS